MRVHFYSNIMKTANTITSEIKFNVKFLFIHSFLLFLCLNVSAQRNYLNIEHKSPLVYCDAYVGLSNGSLAGFGQNLILGNSWGIYAGFMNGHLKSKDQPTDYRDEKPGMLTVIPKDKFYETSFRLTKMLTANRVIRFKVELGVASLKYKTVHFQPYQVYVGSIFDIFGLGSGSPITYYHSSYTQERSFGLSTRLVTEFAVSRCLGLHVALLGTVTPKHSFFGIETGIDLGRVREKRD